MTTQFNLFDLYIPEEDVGPRSHISCTGNGIYLIIGRLLRDIEKEKISIYSISKKIASKLNYHPDTIVKMLRRRNKMISLAALKELVGLWRKICKKSKLEEVKYLEEINENIEWLGCGSSYRTEMRAVKKLDNKLAKIIGAHHADGNLFKEKSKNGTYYKFCIIDGYKSNLIAFQKWFLDVFGVKLKISKAICDAWIINVKNKIFGRYLEVIFGYPTGIKSDLDVPKMISGANYQIKSAYVLGFLTFDGSVEMDRKVSMGIKSKDLRDWLCLFLEPTVRISKKEVYGFYHFTTSTLSKTEYKRWMSFFEEGTEKWYKLNEFLFGFTNEVRNMKEASEILDKVFITQSRSSVSFSEAIYFFSDNNLVKRSEIAQYFGVAESSIYKYLYILEMSNIILKKKISRYHYWEFNPNINEWLVPSRPWLNS